MKAIAVRIGLVAVGGSLAAIANYLAGHEVGGTATAVIVLILRDLDKVLEAKASA